jgi:hypothetical protein
MDTRFWGPSGWKMLHLITFHYSYSPENAILFAKFFETIPYILPCKFCRSSLTDYYKQHPYTHKEITNGYMNPQLDVKKWMYTIHNCVNNKLRKQGLHPASNPTYTSVMQYYDKFSKAPWEAQLASFWDFLFAVGYHYPKYIKVEPMPDSPPLEKCKGDMCEMNKWNVLPVKERMIWYKRFWSLLPVILPSEIAKRWQQLHIKPTLYSRQATLSWLWKMRCALDTQFKDPYTAICKRIKSFSSDCSHSNTCRKTQKHSTRTQKHSTRTRKRSTKKKHH